MYPDALEAGYERRQQDHLCEDDDKISDPYPLPENDIEDDLFQRVEVLALLQ